MKWITLPYQHLHCYEINITRKMTLEKEMIRLFDPGETDTKENQKNFSRKSCFSRSQKQLQPNSCFIVQTSNFVKLRKQNKEKALNFSVNNLIYPWTRLRKKNSWRNIGCFSLKTVIFLLYLIFVILPQVFWSLPLPNPQLIVRSQSLLFSNQQFG